MITKTDINLVAQNNKSTVVCEFTPSKDRATSYQSEDDLEKAFIKELENQAYEYLNIRKEEELIQNLRTQLEKLNNYKFSDNEWNYFFSKEIASQNQTIVDKTATIQEDHIKVLKRDTGENKNIYLIDKENIHNNSLQVINQYEIEGQRKNRYDVTILVNGLPLIHVELKRRGVVIQEAFNQINRYQRESFWASSGLFEYVQLFVISNGTQTKYYSNTTRFQHLKEANNQILRKKKSSNSFEFTSWWADKQNKPIPDLMDFSKTFFAKHTILNILTKYCVFTEDRQLLAMRPYQIVATEKILNKIQTSTNYKQYGTINAGGYIWHTTGSGKTLTSFKTAQLVSKLEYTDKVLFVVDRKDLDYQTMKEYDKFEKGAANSNTSTAKLKKQLEDSNSKIIVTTIQKLDKFIKKNKGHTIFEGQIVLIFDECHRSQFGDMHTAITKSFNKYYLFGFTGTPIFAKNSSSSSKVDLRTTEQAFGDKLHTYTIVNAIADKNVLPFKVDYISTIKEKENIEDKEVSNIDRKAALEAPQRIENNVKYILEHFNQKTMRNSSYKLNERRLKGFNSIFAVSSIDMAKKYYIEFKKQLENLPSDKQLKIATIFSFTQNEEENEDFVDDENVEDTSELDQSSRDFLESAIEDYNQYFSTSYDTSADKFQNYYKDVSDRMKNREIDILIVVNMFLTGFDATTLNTLWVDKNLKHHGLLQAFSRTNRILNSVKRFGNIICFRNLEDATNKAISLFGDKEAQGIVLLKTYKEYYFGYLDDNNKEVKGYKTLVTELVENFPVTEPIIIGENNQKEFIKLFGAILRVKNILNTFDEFEGNEILSYRDFQDYIGIYQSLREEYKKLHNTEKENINDDVVFEMELIKQIEINIDYILELIKKHHNKNTQDKELLADINRAIDSSVELRSKKDLIEQFISTLSINSDIDDEWIEFVEKKKNEELNKIIEEENLNKDETFNFVENSFKNGEVVTTGTALTKILPPLPRFSKDSNRSEKRNIVIEKLNLFFERFFNITNKK